jgi:hypothetical protein
VPVIGSATVSGTIAATQSGAWHVEIAGTPSVKNVDEPGRNPYQALAGFGFGSGFTCSDGPPPSCLGEIRFPAVPAGMRLVAARISGEIITNNGVNIGESILGTAPAVTAVAFVPVTSRSQVSASETLFQFNQELLNYFAAGVQPDYSVYVAGGTSVKGEAILTGYLVSVP